jgi:hypothetical protein
MKLQRQTQVATVGYGLVFASFAILVLSASRDSKESAFANLLMMSISIPITLYVINCTVTGGCKVYAWIHAYLALGAGVLFALITAYFLLAMPSKK